MELINNITKSIFEESNQVNKDISKYEEMKNNTKYEDDITDVNLNEKNNPIKKQQQDLKKSQDFFGEEDNKQRSTKNMTTKQPKINNNKVFIENIYSKALLSRNINISINNIGKNFRDIIENILKHQIEEKCVVEGFIKKNSIKIITHSSGLIKSNFISFDVVFECYLCFPVEGMLIKCIVKNITKAGIKAESSLETPSPFILFLSREHHYNNKYFNSLIEGDVFLSRVIGQRFELNDNHIYIIGELIKPRN
jgi:DNA-directed RNA polymerase subunit E'/Rpb7